MAGGGFRPVLERAAPALNLAVNPAGAALVEARLVDVVPGAGAAATAAAGVMRLTTSLVASMKLALVRTEQNPE